MGVSKREMCAATHVDRRQLIVDVGGGDGRPVSRRGRVERRDLVEIKTVEIEDPVEIKWPTNDEAAVATHLTQRRVGRVQLRPQDVPYARLSHSATLG